MSILMSTHNIPFSTQKKENHPNYSRSAAMGFFSKGFKNKFETAVLNKPSGFEPLKFSCIWVVYILMRKRKPFHIQNVHPLHINQDIKTFLHIFFPYLLSSMEMQQNK